VQFVVLFPQPDVGRPFVVHHFQTLDVVAFADLQLLLLPQGHFAQHVQLHQLAVEVQKPQSQQIGA